MANLRLSLLCTLLTAVQRHPDQWPRPQDFDDHGRVDYRTILHHVAFAIGEQLIEVADVDRHDLQLTARGRRAHAVLCDPQRASEMKLVVGDRTADELSEWLEEPIGPSPRGRSRPK